MSRQCIYIIRNGIKAHVHRNIVDILIALHGNNNFFSYLSIATRLMVFVLVEFVSTWNYCFFRYFCSFSISLPFFRGFFFISIACRRFCICFYLKLFGFFFIFLWLFFCILVPVKSNLASYRTNNSISFIFLKITGFRVCKT